jgi:hypothetical protein
MYDVIAGSIIGILAGCVYLLHLSLSRLELKHADLQRKESISNRSRIAACKALEDLISSRCVDIEKHIETYQDLQRKKFKTVHTRIDDGSFAMAKDRERVTERLDNLTTGCVQTNTRLDKWIKDFRNQLHCLQLESIGVSVPARELNAEEVSA